MPATGSFLLWLNEWMKGKQDGEALPSLRTLSVKWRLSDKTIRRALDVYKLDGTIVSIPGKGLFLRKAPLPIPTTQVKSITSYDSLLETLLSSISRGHFKRGNPLPSLKSICLNYSVSARIVTLVYRELIARGYAFPIGKRVWVGELRSEVHGPRMREVNLYRISGSAGALYTGSRLAKAFIGMEKELNALGYSISYREYDPNRFESEIIAAASHKKGFILADISQKEYEHILPFLKSAVKHYPPVSGLITGKRVKPLIPGIAYVCHGHIGTGINRSLIQYMVMRNIRMVKVVFADSTQALKGFRALVRLIPEFLRDSPGAEFAIYIDQGKGIDTLRDFLSRLYESASEGINYFQSVMSEYGPLSFNTLINGIRYGKTPRAPESGAGELWVFTSTEHAERTVGGLAKSGIGVPENVHLIDLENLSAKIPCGISTCMPDWENIGYFMAHALIHDLPSSVSSKGYLRTQATIIHRRTTTRI